MKSKYAKIIIMFSLIFAVTGCATQLKDEENKVVQNPETGQNLISNIICQPENETTVELYNKNDININALPKCSKFSVTDSNYEGLWVTIFIKPLSLLLIKLGEFLNSYGFAIIIVTLLLRMAVYPFTKKTAEQSEYMKQAKPELEKLEKKYKDKTDQESMMAKSQEMLMIYRKYKINPMSSLVFAFLQMFLFLAFYETLNRIPVLFEETFLGLFQLGTTPLRAISMGNYYYLIFNVLIVAATYFSFKLNSTASMSKEQENQMKTMSKIMVFVIGFVSFNVAVGIGLYWVFNSLFTIIQNLIVKRKKEKNV